MPLFTVVRQNERIREMLLPVVFHFFKLGIYRVRIYLTSTFRITSTASRLRLLGAHTLSQR